RQSGAVRFVYGRFGDRLAQSIEDETEHLRDTRVTSPRWWLVPWPSNSNPQHWLGARWAIDNGFTGVYGGIDFSSQGRLLPECRDMLIRIILASVLIQGSDGTGRVVGALGD